MTVTWHNPPYGYTAVVVRVLPFSALYASQVFLTVSSTGLVTLFNYKGTKILCQFQADLKSRI